MSTSLAVHTLQLATELLDDIELSRFPISALVLKAARLARLVGDSTSQQWLEMELHGYYDSELGRRYMSLTGRWLDEKAKQGYWQGIVELEAQISAHESLLSASQVANLSGDGLIGALAQARQAQARIATAISRFTGTRAKVLALLHQFAVSRFYELAFSAKQAELFESVRQQVDVLLSPLSGDTLAKVESIYQRLSEGDEEAVSQALTTCRRLIDAVADAIYPPTNQALAVNGEEIALGAANTRNRLNAYIRERTQSDSRRNKLRRTLADLYDRVSAGVHSEVSIDEARFLFFNSYLYLGEVLTLATVTDVGEVA
ncbi:MAG: hypothetical protein AB1673_13745 [Actinomycetota bacterium]